MSELSEQLPKRPIVFGVAGGTASGKTTVAQAILKAVGASQIAYVPQRGLQHMPNGKGTG